MAFNEQWDETIPLDTEEVSLGASRIRSLTAAVQERMKIEHSWAATSSDGQHLPGKCGVVYYKTTAQIAALTSVPDGALAFDTTLKKWQVSASSNWVDLIQGKKRLVTSTTIALTLTEAHDLVLGDATTAAFAITLPAVSAISGKEYICKKVDAGANAITVTAAAGDSIDAAATKVLAAEFDSVHIISDGVLNWEIV